MAIDPIAVTGVDCCIWIPQDHYWLVPPGETGVIQDSPSDDGREMVILKLDSDSCHWLNPESFQAQFGSVSFSQADWDEPIVPAGPPQRPADPVTPIQPSTPQPGGTATPAPTVSPGSQQTSEAPTASKGVPVSTVPIKDQDSKPAGPPPSAPDIMDQCLVCGTSCKVISLTWKGISEGKERGYEDWVPEGNCEHPDKAGNYLQVTAKLSKGLKAKAGYDVAPPSLPMVNYMPSPTSAFTFHLSSSCKPGICINWPPPQNVARDDFDLRLANDEATKDANTTLILEDQDQRASTPKDPNREYTEATVRINCLDFGAYGDLVIQARVVSSGGLGGIRFDDHTRRVRIPKRTGFSHIADKWKHDLKIADKDWFDTWDEENIPVGRTRGDGLSLYEEYRGAVIGGKHTRLVNEKTVGQKKLFVAIDPSIQPSSHAYDLITAGIETFEYKTKIRVFSGLRSGASLASGPEKPVVTPLAFRRNL
jgi:hypothetical protein